MKKLLAFVIFGLLPFSNVFAQTDPFARIPKIFVTNFQDFWWNPKMNGMGWNIAQQENTIFATWFLYDDSGKPTFLLFSGDLTGSGATKTVEGNLFRATGNPLGPNFNPAASKTTAVGTANISFTSSNFATFVYDFEGKKGNLTLERFSYAPIDITGVWVFNSEDHYFGCMVPSQNGISAGYGKLEITKNSEGSQYTFKFTDSFIKVNNVPLTIVHSVTLSQAGAMLTGKSLSIDNAGYYSEDGVLAIRKIDDILHMQLKGLSSYGPLANIKDVCTVQRYITATH